MGLLQGSPLPSVTETTTTKDVTPTGYTKYLEDLATAGSTAMGRTGEQLVAGYDPLQTMGYGQLPQAVGAYKPGLTAAGQTAAQAAQGITPQRINELMNPYTSGVVDEMARLQQQNVQRNLLPTMKAGFVGTGGLGSQRYAGALGQSMADIQANLLGAQTGALQKGFTEATKAALDEAQLRNLTARTQADIAKQEQELGVSGAGALTKAGAERQKFEQAKLDAPLAIALQSAGLMKGQSIPLDQTKTFVGPRTRDYYQLSNLAKASGALGLLGAMGPQLGSMGSSLGRYLGISGGGGLNWNSPLGGLSNSSVGYGEQAAEQEYLRFLAELDAANYGYGEAPDYSLNYGYGEAPDYSFYDYGPELAPGFNWSSYFD